MSPAGLARLPPIDSRPVDPAVRGLLASASPESRQALKEALFKGQASTCHAVADLLSQGPESDAVTLLKLLMDDPCSIPIEMLEALWGASEQSSARLRNGTAELLGASQNESMLARLIERSRDVSVRQSARLSATLGLGRSMHRDAADALVGLLDDADPQVRRASFNALERIAGRALDGDVSAARSWWESMRGRSAAQWQREQLQRAQRSIDGLTSERDGLALRLAGELRAAYLRMDPSARPELLLQYLRDGIGAVRILGLELARDRATDGHALEPEVVVGLRQATQDPDPRVRAAAVRALVGLRDPKDEKLLLELLRAHQSPDARIAIYGGLGYLGSGTAVTVLLSALPMCLNNEQIAVVTALGRLAERGVLRAGTPDYEEAGRQLLGIMKRCDRSDADLRERVIWALGRLSNPQLRTQFEAALDAREAGVVRQAAIGALALLGDDAATQALVEAARDSDLSVRRSVIERLSKLPVTPASRTALWNASLAALEPDVGVRQTAWSGLLRVMESRSLVEIQAALDRLPADDPETPARCEELVRAGLASAPAATDVSQQRLELRWKQAQLCRQAGDSARAMAAYLAGLDEFAIPNELAEPFVMEALEYALRSGQYDVSLAAAIRRFELPDLCVESIAGVLQDLARTDRAGAMQALSKLLESPPAVWSQQAFAPLQHLDEQWQRAGAAPGVLSEDYSSAGSPPQQP